MITVSSNNVRNGLGLARRHLGISRRDSREILRTYLSHKRYSSLLADGTIVITELTVPWPRGKPAEVVSDRV